MTHPIEVQCISKDRFWRRAWNPLPFEIGVSPEIIAEKKICSDFDFLLSEYIQYIWLMGHFNIRSWFSKRVQKIPYIYYDRPKYAI